MAPLDDTTPATRFDSFNVYRIPYKKVGDHEIEVGILVPKDLKPGAHPLIVKFHGGGLVSLINTPSPQNILIQKINGDCLYPDWIGAFWIPFIHRTSAITVLPNYRLIPESTGADILEDLNDFWKWFHAGNLTKFLASQHGSIELDYSHVLASGDSAGGYMALMSALTQPRGAINAVLAQYPMTNALRIAPGGLWFGEPAPGPEVLERHIAAMRPGAIVSSAAPPARSALSYPMGAYDRYLEFFGADEKMWPVGLIEEAEWMPPTWIVHGDADSAVSVEDTRGFVEKWGKFVKEGEVRMAIREGMEHGFDDGMKEDEEEWLREGLEWVREKWLA
jgi:acetyl esterase/lipase